MKLLTNSKPEFNKLLNPLHKYLNDILITDSLGTTKLLQFLRSIVETKQETNLSSSDPFLLLRSYCQGKLLNNMLAARD